MARAEEVISLIEKSSWDLGAEGITFSNIFESAQAKKKLPQVHSLYSEVKPAGSKLKEGCHWSNLKSSVVEDLLTHGELEAVLSAKYINYLAHFGEKHLLIEEIESTSLKSDFRSHDFTVDLGWVPEASNLIDNESPEATVSSVKVISQNKTTDGISSFLLKESIEAFYLGNPPAAFLSDVGKDFQSSMKLKKRVVRTGFHKVIMNADFNLRVILIDPRALVGNETAPDKAVVVVNAVRSVLASPSKLEEKKARVAFFPAVKQIYEDASIGRVVGGYFYTSGGARYVPDLKGSGSDLRKDPFQQGGEQASTEPINFIKIEVEFVQEPGRAHINLIGSADMFERPDTSLYSMEVQFSTKSGGSAAFLLKPLSYGKWK